VEESRKCINPNNECSPKTNLRLGKKRESKKPSQNPLKRVPLNFPHIFTKMPLRGCKITKLPFLSIELQNFYYGLKILA